MKGTIQDWEDARFASEAAAEIDAIPVTDVVRLEQAEDVDRPEIVALCGRQNSGLSVQLLTTVGDDIRAWITLDVGGRTETVEIRPQDALDAFQHPYAYGASLPL